MTSLAASTSPKHSSSATTLRKILAEVVGDTKFRSENDEFSALFNTLLEDEYIAELRIAVRYWFDNHRKTVAPPDPATSRVRSAAIAVTKARTREREETAAVEIKKVVSEVASAAAVRRAGYAERLKLIESMSILDTILPSGKRLGDATFGEVAELGGIYTKLGASGRPRQIICKHLTAAKVNEICAT